jgi:hypothetical protein
MEWLDATPVTLDPQEALMIRMEGPNHFGCWMYFSPPDAPEDWPMSEAAHQVRILIESRAKTVAP